MVDILINFRYCYVDSGGGIKEVDMNGNLTWFEFGPDGAFYTLENAGGKAVVTRITPVPEPASIILLSSSIILLSFGAVFLKRRMS